MTRSNKMMEENRKNPKGYGHSAPNTALLLLGVESTPAASLLVSDAKWTRIAAGAIIEMGSKQQ